MNQIFVIKPYLWNGIWVFDDPRVGLVREALIEGMPEIIQAATAQAGIANPERGFIALFSHEPFPNAMEMEWVRESSNGNVYRWQGREGWLCPALFKVLQEHPCQDLRSGQTHGPGVGQFRGVVRDQAGRDRVVVESAPGRLPRKCRAASAAVAGGVCPGGVASGTPLG